jgi:hypothetical protein
MPLLLGTLLCVAALGYVGIAGYLYARQRSRQYFPTKKGLSPADVGLDGVSEQTIRTVDGETIIAWYSPAAEGMPTILFFHGNGGEVSDRAERLRFYSRQGFGALFVSYRGYGKSTGRISERGLVRDGIAAYDWLAARGITPRQIAVVGESLGTGVAVQVAALKPVMALALEAPFSAAVDIAATIYPWLPVRLLMKDTFKSREFIGKVSAPLLVQHGDADEVVPVAQGRSLFGMADQPKELVIIPGAGHDVVNAPALWAREADFFRRQMGSAQ